MKQENTLRNVLIRWGSASAVLIVIAGFFSGDPWAGIEVVAPVAIGLTFDAYAQKSLDPKKRKMARWGIGGTAIILIVIGLISKDMWTGLLIVVPTTLGCGIAAHIQKRLDAESK